MDRIHKFESDQFHSGFYIEGCGNKEVIRRLLDNIDFDQYDYWNDENAALPLPYECASIFLHGSCNIFAYELHKRFGYDVYEIKSRDGKVTHWFCQSILREKPVYIDVRGMTTDFDEFLSEFKYGMGDDYVISYREEDEIIISDEEMWEDAGKAFAQAIICMHPEFYEVK